jgi:hypothetical protein
MIERKKMRSKTSKISFKIMVKCSAFTLYFHPCPETYLHHLAQRQKCELQMRSHNMFLQCNFIFLRFNYKNHTVSFVCMSDL